MRSTQDNSPDGYDVSLLGDWNLIVEDPLRAMCQVRQRYYDPAIGRFVSEDPIRQAGGDNLFAYTQNDPVNKLDPSGHEDQDKIAREQQQQQAAAAAEAERQKQRFALVGAKVLGPNVNTDPYAAVGSKLASPSEEKRAEDWSKRGPKTKVSFGDPPTSPADSGHQRPPPKVTRSQSGLWLKSEDEGLDGRKEKTFWVSGPTGLIRVDAPDRSARGTRSQQQPIPEPQGEAEDIQGDQIPPGAPKPGTPASAAASKPGDHASPGHDAGPSASHPPSPDAGAAKPSDASSPTSGSSSSDQSQQPAARRRYGPRRYEIGIDENGKPKHYEIHNGKFYRSEWKTIRTREELVAWQLDQERRVDGPGGDYKVTGWKFNREYIQGLYEKIAAGDPVTVRDRSVEPQSLPDSREKWAATQLDNAGRARTWQATSLEPHEMAQRGVDMSDIRFYSNNYLYLRKESDQARAFFGGQPGKRDPAPYFVELNDGRKIKVDRFTSEDGQVGFRLGQGWSYDGKYVETTQKWFRDEQAIQQHFDFQDWLVGAGKAIQNAAFAGGLAALGRTVESALNVFRINTQIIRAQGRLKLNSPNTTEGAVQGLEQNAGSFNPTGGTSGLSGGSATASNAGAAGGSMEVSGRGGLSSGGNRVQGDVEGASQSSTQGNRPGVETGGNRAAQTPDIEAPTSRGPIEEGTNAVTNKGSSPSMETDGEGGKLANARPRIKPTGINYDISVDNGGRTINVRSNEVINPRTGKIEQGLRGPYHRLDATFDAESGDLHIDMYQTFQKQRGVGTEMISKTIETVGSDRVRTLSGEFAHDNLEQYNRAIQNGATPEQAAAQTPLGKSAAALGYTKVAPGFQTLPNGKQRPMATFSKE